MRKICKVDGCSNFRHGGGYCGKHYYQIKKHGKILEVSKFDPNKIILEEEHAKIELRDGKYNIVGYALIDLDDVKRCSKHKWCSTGKSGYVVARINGRLTTLHRFILGNTTEHTDHKKRNKLDNRKSEIRGCTAQENSFNTKVSINNTSGHKGVYFCKRSKVWYAQIFLKQGTLTSKRYKKKQTAINWRNEMEDKYHGEFKS